MTRSDAEKAESRRAAELWASINQRRERLIAEAKVLAAPWAEKLKASGAFEALKDLAAREKLIREDEEAAEPAIYCSLVTPHGWLKLEGENLAADEDSPSLMFSFRDRFRVGGLLYVNKESPLAEIEESYERMEEREKTEEFWYPGTGRVRVEDCGVDLVWNFSYSSQWRVHLRRELNFTLSQNRKTGEYYLRLEDFSLRDPKRARPEQEKFLIEIPEAKWSRESLAEAVEQGYQRAKSDF